MRRFSLAAALALFALSPLPALADPACRLMGSIMADAVAMREQGYSQRQTANYLAAQIGEGASNARGSRAERQLLANRIGRVSTHLLQFAYSVELRRDVNNPRMASEIIYAMCMRGEI
ncbi:MAG: hypothetical protein Q4F71_06400 [Paracoccus sp. (in: a-proteobacteria)]|nr:hypothetical protein [Paracoccus sp. (in: a-proteobacteria)]